MKHTSQVVPSEPKQQLESGIATAPSDGLVWQDVVFSVGDKTILDKCSGRVARGELCVLMGPSGSGKTSLLDFIAGRLNDASDRTLSGAVSINGMPRTPELLATTASYVQQQDSLVGTLTVRETLTVSARLHGISPEKCPAAVEQVLEQTGLVGAADVNVGTVFFKGISGGQKRRLSIAEQLLQEPSVMMLDEPTSGLDSASALAVTSHLKSCAQKSSRCIMATLHQPSSQMWELFDKVCFMVDGKMVYFGDPCHVVSHFEGLTGRPCPVQTNPADYVIALINRDFENHADTAALALAWAESAYNTALATAPLDAITTAAAGVNADRCHRAGFFSRLCTLLGRDLKELLRDPGVIYVRLFMYVMLSLLIGMMFYDLGDNKDDSGVLARTGVLSYVTNLLIMAIAALPFFMLQREVFVKERCNGAYGVSEYCVSKWLVSLPGLGLLALASSVIVVPMTGLNGFDTFLLALFTALVFAEGFMYTIAALVPHYIIGMALAAGAFGFCMLCEGFLVVKSKIPGYMLWGHYMAPHTYTFRIFMYNEFHSLGALSSTQFATGDALLKFYDMEDTDLTSDFMVIIGFVVFFQATFFASLYFLHTGKR